MLFSSQNKAKVDQSFLKEFISHYPFALIQNVVDNKIYTSAAPCLFKEIGNDFKLVTHFPVENPHLQLLGERAQLLFQGPQMYVSPQNYTQPENMLPTWCFSWLEITSQITIIKDTEVIKDHLNEMFLILQNEHQLSLNELNFSKISNLRLLDKLVVLELSIESFDAVIKWGSEKKEADQKALLEAFKARKRNEVEVDFHNKLRKY